MGKRLGRILVMQALLAVVVTAAACNKLKKSDSSAVGQGPNPGGGQPGMPGGPWPGGPGWKAGPIHEIMVKLMKGGPQSLFGAIGQELNEPTPPWDKLQPQTKEFSQLVTSVSKYDPPRGDKESWQKQTAAFSKSATDLEQAAQAKDTDAARSAHQTIQNSCKACHTAHKGPGGMGPGGFRGRGGRPGGPGGPPQQ